MSGSGMSGRAGGSRVRSIKNQKPYPARWRRRMSSHGSFATAQTGVRLAAIHPGSFSRKDSSLPGSGNNASSLRPEPVAVLARLPVGYRQAEQREPRRQAHTHNRMHTPPEDNCRQVDTRGCAHRSSGRNPAGPVPDRSRLHSPTPHLRRDDGGDAHGGAHAHAHVLCRPTQGSRELR